MCISVEMTTLGLRHSIPYILQTFSAQFCLPKPNKYIIMCTAVPIFQMIATRQYHNNHDCVIISCLFGKTSQPPNYSNKNNFVCEIG